MGRWDDSFRNIVQVSALDTLALCPYLAWVRFSPQGRVLSASAAAARLLGYTQPEQLVERSLFDPASWTRWNEAVRQSPGQAQELPLLTHNGGSIWVLMSGCEIGENITEGWLVDITRYKQQEATLARTLVSGREHEIAERRFRALLESAPDAILISAGSGRILMANQQSEKLFACPRAEILGRSIEDFMPERFREHHRRLRGEYNRQPRTRMMGAGLELYARRRDGVEIPVEISLSPIEIDGEWVVASAIRDVSERKRAEAALHRLHQLELAQTEHLASLGEIAAGLAHEIKNPLAGIAAVLEVLAGNFGNAPESRELMSEVQQQVVRIRSIVDELLNYARPRPLALVPGDLNEAVARAVQFALPRAQLRQLRLTFLPRSLPVLQHDPEQIQRMVLNLVMNAIEALPPGGQIEVLTQLDPSAQQVTISVRDDGPGIASAEQEKIFRPFYTTKGKHGTGLGLSLCRRIAELHGGTIRVESHLGEGSRFIVTLPLENAREAQP